MELDKIDEFLSALGAGEYPIGMYYSNERPDSSITPKKGILPSLADERASRVDWKEINANWCCVIGLIWRARKSKSAAFVDGEHFGCLGGAFYLGYLKPQLDGIAAYISTGIEGYMEGERYLDSPESARRFFNLIDPAAAPAQHCIFKPLNLFAPEEKPDLVTFFSRSEMISGLNQLATFVTNDFEIVSSPFGAGCTSIVSWPLYYLRKGQMKAILGGWDPSERKYLKTDEITFTMPWALFELMIENWKSSFLASKSWDVVKKRINKSSKIWGEQV